MFDFLKGWFVVWRILDFLKGWFFLVGGFEMFLKGRFVFWGEFLVVFKGVVFFFLGRFVLIFGRGWLL